MTLREGLFKDVIASPPVFAFEVNASFDGRGLFKPVSLFPVGVFVLVRDDTLLFFDAESVFDDDIVPVLETVELNEGVALFLWDDTTLSSPFWGVLESISDNVLFAFFATVRLVLGVEAPLVFLASVITELVLAIDALAFVAFVVEFFLGVKALVFLDNTPSLCCRSIVSKLDIEAPNLGAIVLIIRASILGTLLIIV